MCIRDRDKEYIDLIISDIMMPVMDGYELVSELRSAGYQIPVLMITAKGSFASSGISVNGMVGLALAWLRYCSARFLIIFFIQYSSFSGLRSE